MKVDRHGGERSPRPAAPGGTALTVRRIYNADRWNCIVQGFPRYDLRQGFEWGELRAEQRWRPVRFAVLRDAEPVAACAVLCRAIPGAGGILYVPRGPLFRSDVPAGLDRVLEELRALGRRTRAIAVRISPPVPMDDTDSIACLDRSALATVPEPWTTWNSPRYVQVLHLRRHEAELLRGVRRRFREYIAAAPRRRLVIEPSDRDDDLVEFHALMLDAGRMKGFPVRDLAWYRALVRHYRPERAVTLLVAREQDTMVGGLLAVRFGRKSYMLYTSVRGTLAESARHHVAPALCWEYSRRARAEGCELADLGGTGVGIPPQEGDPGWGLYHFKAGLGCSLETFVHLRDMVLRPLLYRLFRACEAQLLPPLWRLVARAPRAWPARLVGAAA
ncbi:MAG: peptidoglycan bridge formation glycyltransferase FemA/FemB family protein [Candidatus Rokubacteria bacterium]|nr:peptidoglycan bridge formation glycyltransferase FemA/FemB family protein [Candidatus Rokubacteria bacterium]